MRVALIGLVTISIYKIAFTGFKTGPGVIGFLSHVEHEWVILANLLCLLMGFALLSRHFEKSHVPVALPKYLPHDWKGGFILFLSSFLDNIAAALIGGAMAHRLFRAKVRIGIVGLVLGLWLATSVIVNVKFTGQADHFPFLGMAVWVAILLSVGLRRPDWEVLPRAFRGSIFLLSLVLITSMMPVEKLPLASWRTTLGLGFLSAVFDNIPLTALALKQNGYDRGMLAYAVGFVAR
jgi:hypothetical protein